MATSPAGSPRGLQVTGVRRPRPGTPSTRQLIERLREQATASESLVALFDAQAIAGERHLLSAWAHLGRSRRGGTSRLRDRGAELALYVAGEDQLPRALAKVGIADATERFVLVVERPLVLEEIRARFGLEEDPSAYPRPPDEGTLDRLGIGAPERSVVPRSAWEGLVLERVALIDLAPGATAPRGKG